MQKQKQAFSRLVETTPEFKTEISNLPDRPMEGVYFFHGEIKSMKE